MQLLIAFLHHLAVLTVLASSLTCVLLLRQSFDLVTARRLGRIDMINGIAATLVLVVGLIRVAYLEKGTDYYFHNGPFIAKLALYGLASVLSLVPTLEICPGQAFSHRPIGCLIADFCSKALGGKLPSLECSRWLL